MEEEEEKVGQQGTDPQPEPASGPAPSSLVLPRELRSPLWRRWATIRALMIMALIGLLILLIWGIQVKQVSFTDLVSLTIWGLILGSIIALGAIGLSLVYGILRFANFAHGDLMAVGAYIVLLFIGIFPQGSRLAPFSFGWGFLAALPLAMIGTAGVALAIDKVIYAPLRRQRTPPVLLAMASLGAALLVRSLIFITWGADFRFYYAGTRQALTLPLGIRIRYDQLLILGLAVTFVVFIYLFLERTKLGKAMRATADNVELAQVTGIDIGRVIFWTWTLGAGMAAVGGALLGLDAQVRPGMGWFFLIPLFAAVILGGIGNPYGALAGGLIIGVVQQVSTAFLNPSYKPAVAFIIMLIILLVRPQGLFGKRE